jgi:hypothetical protein
MPSWLNRNEARYPFESVLQATCVAWCQWLVLVILATWEAEIGKIALWGQPRQIVHKIPSKWIGGVV